jgi:hypothetical protein
MNNKRKMKKKKEKRNKETKKRQTLSSKDKIQIKKIALDLYSV